MISNQFASRIQLLRDKVESFECFPFCLPAIRSLTTLELHPKVTFFVGENGSGKSTLLEGIAVSLGLNAEGGSKNFQFETRRSHSVLERYLRISKGFKRPRDSFFLRSESFFNVGTEIENLDKEPGGPPVISYYGGLSLHEQSHGESFIALLMNRFRGDGLYILDEPEAALSPQRQLAALARIHDLATDHSQFLIATHSPILMAYPNAWVYQFSAAGIERVEFKDTENFRIMKNFLEAPDRMLRQLLDNTN